MVSAYVGMTDDTTFFGGMNTHYSKNHSSSLTNNESKCPGGTSHSYGSAINGNGSSTHSVVTENHSTFLRRQSSGQITISTYSSSSPPYNNTSSYDNDSFYVEACPGDPAFTCSQSNSSLTRNRSWDNARESTCGSVTDYGNESISKTLTSPLSQGLAEQWARANFGAYPSAPFVDPEPSYDWWTDSYQYESGGYVSLVGNGESGPNVPYVRIYGDREYRLLFLASRSPDDPPSTELYSPSPTGYLKVWLQKNIIIQRSDGMSWPPYSETTTSETTLVFTEKIPKSQLVAGQFYSSDVYQIASDLLAGPIQNTAFASHARVVQVYVIGYTFDANYTGATPP